ncbi:MAG: glycosyltransferase family 4 protein [Paludibacteraceae bacterium]
MAKGLKVLSVNTSDKNGGAARAAFRIHHGVRSLAVDSRMFVKDRQSNEDTVISLDTFVPTNVFHSILVYVQKKIKNKIQHYRWGKYPDREKVMLSDLRSVSIYDAFQKLDFDVLHLHWVNLRFLNLKELENVHKPIVWTLHDSWAFTGICHYTYSCDNYSRECGNCPFLRSNKDRDLSWQVWKQKRKIYRKLNLHIVTPSQWLADCVAKSSLLQGFPVTVIPNGLDTIVYSPGDKKKACEKFGLDPSYKIILFGAINPSGDKNKGFSELLEAIQYLEKRSAGNLTLAVFGTDQPIDIVTSIPIHYLGYLHTDELIVEAYRTANVMVVPSISEVFGQTASEAMACGVPVVAFNCTGIKEVVYHKITGYLAEPYRSEDLANGIVWCLENNDEGVLSKNARERVVENYAQDIVATSYKSLYENLL